MSKISEKKTNISDDLTESDSIDSSTDTNNDTISNEKLSVKQVKDVVWKKFCPKDKNIGNCFCCNDEIRKDKTHVEYGHIIPRCKGGKYIVNNIRPVCIKCNRGKGGMLTMNMYEYIVRNNMYGIKHLKKKERELYVYSSKEKKKAIKKSIKLLNVLYNESLIDKKLKTKLQKILTDNKDPKKKSFQSTITFIKSFTELNKHIN